MYRLIKVVFFTVLTHLTCGLQAQFGFEKTIKFSLDAESPWHIFEDQQGHFILSATTSLDAQRSLLAIKLKPNGNTKWLCNYGISCGYDDMLWGTQLNNQYYYLGGGYPGSGLFSRVSNNGVVLQDTMYSNDMISSVQYRYQCGVVFQQKIYAGGQSQPKWCGDVFCPSFNVLDLQGNIISHQQFCDTFDQVIRHLFITQNKQINAIVDDYSYGGCRLFVFDTLGNLLTKKRLFSWIQEIVNYVDVVQHADDTYTFLIEKNSRPFLLRTNNLGDTLRTYLVETNQPEDTILASFDCLTANNNFDYFLAGVGALVKIDSNGFKTVLKIFEENTTIKKINIAKDGGIYGCGHVLTYTSPTEGNLDLYIFKTDTLGNVIPAPDELFNAAKVVLYPNPANASISILGLPDEAEYAYTITNTLGQKITSGTVQNETPINLQTYNQGLYFITLQNGNQHTTKRFIVE